MSMSTSPIVFILSRLLQAAGEATSAGCPWCKDSVTSTLRLAGNGDPNDDKGDDGGDDGEPNETGEPLYVQTRLLQQAVSVCHVHHCVLV